jgi:hypothetical protein
MRSAWSMSSQKTMVLAKGSVALRNSVILRGDEFGALLQHEAAVEVALVVDAVLDQLAVLVGLPLLWAPALQVLVEVDAHDLVGREEAVVDALLERVGVDRLAEVVDVGDVLRFPWAWRSGRSGWRREVVEDLAPGESSAALPRWHSSMTIRSKKSGENCL